MRHDVCEPISLLQQANDRRPPVHGRAMRRTNGRLRTDGRRLHNVAIGQVVAVVLLSGGPVIAFYQ